MTMKMHASVSFAVLSLLLLCLWEVKAVSVTGLQTATEDVVLRFEASSSNDGSCQCSGMSCSCCKTLDLKPLHWKNKVCANVQFIQEELAIQLSITVDGKEIFKKKISAKNPPAVCTKMKVLGKSVKLCIDFYNLKVEKRGLSGCAQLTAKVVFIKEIKLKLGCFKIGSFTPMLANGFVGNSGAKMGKDFFDILERQLVASFMTGSRSVPWSQYGIFTETRDDGSCKCSGASCSCCETLSIKQFHWKKNVCINVAYLPQEIGIQLSVTLDGKEILKKKISAKNPPDVCTKIKILGKSVNVCIKFYDLKTDKDSLSGCANLTAKMDFIEDIEIALGCFKVSQAEDIFTKTLSILTGDSMDISKEQSKNLREQQLIAKLGNRNGIFTNLRKKRYFSILVEEYTHV